VQPKPVYIITKTMESLLQSSGLDLSISDSIEESGAVFNQTSIDSKGALKSYLMNDFSKIVFKTVTEETSLQNVSSVDQGKTVYKLVN
jgi:hypothetical protein